MPFNESFALVHRFAFYRHANHSVELGLEMIQLIKEVIYIKNKNHATFDVRDDIFKQNSKYHFYVNFILIKMTIHQL